MLKSRRCLKVDAGALGSQRETMDRGRVSDFSIERILSPQLGPRPPLQDFPPNGYHRGVIGNVRAPSPVQVPLQAMGCQQCREMSFGEERFPLYRPAVHQQHFYSNPGVYAHFSQNRAGKQRLSQFKFYFFTKTLRLFFFKNGKLLLFFGFSHSQDVFAVIFMLLFCLILSSLKAFLVLSSPDMQPLAAYSGYPQPSAVPPQSLHKFRVRTVFTDSQIKQLEALFEITEYPSVETRAELARRTGLSEETVRVSPT